MRPSEPLVRLLRETAATRGMNTAALAEAVGLSRNDMKHVLAGTQPLTVDLLVELAEVLELGASELSSLGLELPPEPVPMKTVASTASTQQVQPPDPYGNHAEQILQLGFALGCDMHIVLRTAELSESGVPETSLEQFPDLLPLKLDAAFHHHNDPRFLPSGIRLVLSFDALYTCELPWAAFAQITISPLPPELEEKLPPAEDTGSHLRLIE